MAFGKCVESGFYRILKDTKTAEERREVIDRLAQRLRDEEGLDSALCAEALELLAAAIFGEGQIAPPPAPAVAVTPAAAPPPVMRETPAEPPAAPAATVTPPVAPQPPTAPPPEPSSTPEKGADAQPKSSKAGWLEAILLLFPLLWCILIFEVLGFKSVDNLSAAGFFLFVAGLIGPWVLFVIRVLKRKKKQ
jgi:hypothetical protein